MVRRSLENDPALSWLRSGGQLLLPVKVDITAQGCRLVDSFCWNLFGSMTTFELAGENSHRLIVESAEMSVSTDVSRSQSP